MNAIQLALDDLKEAGKDDPASRPVAVVHADSKGDLNTLEGQAVRLASINRVATLLGGHDPAQVDRLDRAGVPVISPIGVRSKMFSERITVAGLSPAERGKTLAAYLRDEVKPASVAMLVEPGDGAGAGEAAFLEAWADSKRPAPSRRALGETPAESIQAWAESLPADALPVVIGSPDLLKQVSREKPFADRPLAYLGPELMRQSFKDRKAPIFLVTAFGGTEKAVDFAKRYRARFDAPAEPIAALAYDNVRIAVDNVKSTRVFPAQLRDNSTTAREFAGLTGTYKIVGGVVERPAFAGRLTAGEFVEAK